MKLSALKYGVLNWTSLISMAILLLMPFHAFLTVWGSKLVGHYTLLRLWKECLLILCLAAVIYLLLADRKIRRQTLSRRLVWLILIYVALNVIWGLLAIWQGDVTWKALGYGLISNLRYLAFFLVTWSVALRLSRLRTSWRWLVFWPAAIVSVFAVLQFAVLPNDFLSHFGYGPSTIDSYETINSNDQYIRATSFLRGANPLGAYLLIPISLVVMLVITERRNWRHLGVLIASFLALIFSFSRSAWVGAFLTVATVVGVRGSPTFRRRSLYVAAGLVAVATAVFLIFNNDSHFQNVVLHTEDHSLVKTSSNDNHWGATRRALDDIRKHPLGSGPGTAGPASHYNTGHQPRVAENYFLQVAQETGWLGLGLFLAINAGLGYLLWLRRADPLALSLVASLVGLTFINLLSHAWADDTLAYIWWGLAGIAMVPPKAKESTDA